MATTSHLYHAKGLKGYLHLGTEFRDGRIAYHIGKPPWDSFAWAGETPPAKGQAGDTGARTAVAGLGWLLTGRRFSQ